MKLYTTKHDCEVAGSWRMAGVPFSLSDEQAAELTPPRGSVVAPYVPADIKEEPHARLGRNKRRNRKAAH